MRREYSLTPRKFESRGALLKTQEEIERSAPPIPAHFRETTHSATARFSSSVSFLANEGMRDSRP